MGKKPGLSLPKKWIVLVAIVAVAAVVGILLATYKPPELSLDVKMQRIDSKLNLTLTYMAGDVNITSQEYRVRIVARRVVDTVETKETFADEPLPNVGPHSSVSQVFTFEIKGYTDLNIYISKGGKQVIFRTQRIPYA